VRLSATALPGLYAAWMAFVWHTSRVEDAGLESLHDIVAAHDGCVALVFHEDALLSAWACRRLGLRPATLVSVSDAGEVAHRILASCGFQVLRGGSSRRASRRRPLALLGLIRHLQREPRALCAIAVDGSHGPRRSLKSGGLALARAAGKPIVLARVASRPSLRLPTWDRLALPLPFGRIRLELRGPYPLPEDAATRVGLERFRARLEREMLEMASAAVRSESR
jgi:3-deoxy-D-manno-octulosonic-acid transferase